MNDICPAISIIIPVYNCSEYLEECLNSVLSQSINSKEIICINDGSIDDSGEIISKYQKNHKEIVVINQTNQGSGAARNAGLNAARGEFVAFLDGDDIYADKQALEDMYSLCKAHNIHACRALKNNTDGTIYDREQTIIDIINSDGSGSIIQYKEYQFDYDYMCYIFERSLIEENNIRFPLYRRFQDPPFLVKVLFNAKDIILCDRWLYSYRQPVVSSRFNSEKTIDLLNGIKENIGFAKDNNLSVLLENSIDRIDYEYNDIILSHLSGNARILEELKEINKIVYPKEDEMIRCLRLAMDRLNDKGISYKDRLVNDISESQGIYIFGCGNYGQLFLNFLESMELQEKVDSFIVSGSPKSAEIRDIPVKCVNDISDTNIPVYIAVAGIPRKDIMVVLKNRGIKTITILDTVFLDEWDREK